MECTFCRRPLDERQYVVAFQTLHECTRSCKFTMLSGRHGLPGAVLPGEQVMAGPRSCCRTDPSATSPPQVFYFTYTNIFYTNRGPRTAPTCSADRRACRPDQQLLLLRQLLRLLRGLQLLLGLPGQPWWLGATSPRAPTGPRAPTQPVSAAPLVWPPCAAGTAPPAGATSPRGCRRGCRRRLRAGAASPPWRSQPLRPGSAAIPGQRMV